MKLWKKFKVSAALDAGREMDGANAAEPIGQFAANARELERRLRAPCAAAELPANLHANIMRAVRVNVQPESGEVLTLLWNRALAVAVVLLLGIGMTFIIFNQTTNSSQPALGLAVVTTTLQQSQTLPQTAPNAVLAPLSDELELVNQDIEKAVGLLLASLP